MKTSIFELLNQNKILVVGDLVLECKKIGTVNRISPEAPVPIINIKNEILSLSFIERLFNIILNEKTSCELISVIGADNAGKIIHNYIKEVEWVKSFLIVDPLKITPEKIIIFSNQQLLRIDINKQDPLSQEVENMLLNVFKKTINKCDLLLIIDLNKGVISEKIYQEITFTAKMNSKKIVLCSNIFITKSNKY